MASRGEVLIPKRCEIIDIKYVLGERYLVLWTDCYAFWKLVEKKGVWDSLKLLPSAALSDDTRCHSLGWPEETVWEMGMDVMKWNKMYCTPFPFPSHHPSWVAEVLKRCRGGLPPGTNGPNFKNTLCSWNQPLETSAPTLPTQGHVPCSPFVNTPF